MIKIITDSASDIEARQAEELGIILLPMEISFGEEVYRDKFDIQADEFYEKLAEADELPRTSQINPFVFEEAFQKITEDGDEAIAVIMSSGLSGTYESAVNAAKKFPNVYVIDSYAITVGEQCLIYYALEMIKRGMSAKEIYDELERTKSQVKILAILDTLEYLKKGGRISSTVAFAGGLLNIKPVVTVEDGRVGMLGKARGNKNGNAVLSEFVEKFGGVNASLPTVVGYTGNDPSMLERFLETGNPLWKESPVIRIGSTIGTHVGPGAIALGFFMNQ